MFLQPHPLIFFITPSPLSPLTLIEYGGRGISYHTISIPALLSARFISAILGHISEKLEEKGLNEKG